MTFEDIMAFDKQNIGVFNDLKELIKGNHVIPFVGAGISVSLGYPTWKGFLEYCSSLVDLPSPTCITDYFETASKLLDHMARAEFYSVIKDKFGDSIFNLNKANTEAIYLLPRLFNGLCMTTNFDRALENVYPTATPVAHPGHFSVLNQALREGKRLIYKFHGCVSEAEDIIFTKEAYSIAYAPNTELVESLTDCFKRKIILFLGCSLQQDETYKLWSQISQSEKGSYQYTIMSSEPTQKQNERRRLGNSGIRCILYPNGKYECVRIILEQLFLECSPDEYHQLLPKQIIKSELQEEVDDTHQG